MSETKKRVRLDPDEAIRVQEYRHRMRMMRTHLERLSTGPGDDKKRESLEAIRDLASEALSDLDANPSA